MLGCVVALTCCCSFLVFCDVHESTALPHDDGLYTIDGLKAIVFGDDAVDIITLSDVTRPSLDGTMRTLDDLVFEKLIYQDAAKYRMLPAPDAIDRHLKAVQREHNLSLEELKNIFSASGYTYEEGREQFGTITAVATMIDFRIRSRLIVPEKAIIAYYEQHPIMKEECYELAHAVVACPSNIDQKTFERLLASLVETGTGDLDVSWSSPFWVLKSELAQERQFLTTLNVGSITIVGESAAGVELLCMKSKKPEQLTPLAERYQEITDILKRPKYDELLQNYKNELYAAAGIVYF